MDALTEADDLPAIELLPGEVVCRQQDCNLAYNRHLLWCPNCEVQW